MDFKQAEKKFKELKIQFEEGKLTEPEFKTQLEELMVQDGQGNWWMIGYETELWYRYDGTGWVQADLPNILSQKSTPIVSPEHEAVESASAKIADQEKEKREAAEKAASAQAFQQPYQQPASQYTHAVQPSKTKSRSWMTYGVIGLFVIVFCGAIGIWIVSSILNQPASPDYATKPTSRPQTTQSSSIITSNKCNDAIDCVEISPSEPIHIAYMLTISGATAFLGEDSKGAVEIAIDDRGGELFGHKISLTGEDSLCSAEGGQTAATKVASDPTILGVIGTNCSSAATAAMPTISNAGLVMLSPSNTAPALTLEGETWQPGYFRICHTDLFQGSVAAEFAFNELGATTAATIHDGSPYADQLQQVFAGRFQEFGGKITFQGAINVGDTDMRTVLTSVAADSPDVLYYPIFEPEGPFITAQSSEIFGLENTILMGADGLLSDSFPENSGPNVVGMYLSGPYVSGTNYDAFLGKWDAKFGGVPPSGFHAFAYDGTNILLDAIKKVAVVDNDGTIHIGRQALRDAITNTTNYTGLTGKIDCSDDDYNAYGITYPSHGDCATGEALGIFEITQAELDGNWPPLVVYTP